MQASGLFAVFFHLFFHPEEKVGGNHNDDYNGNKGQNADGGFE